MTSHAVAIEQPAVTRAQRRPGVLEGAWLLPGAMVASGLLTYAFLVLAARRLGADAYGQIGVLWGTMFIAAIVLFRPLEQTASRAIADRLARGEGVKPVLQTILALGAVVAASALVVGGVGWGAIGERLFGGNQLMTAMLIGGVAAYGFAYIVRGLLGGARWFAGYGLGLVADGVARLAIAAPLVFVASQSLAAAALVGAGLAGAIVPLYLGRRALRPLVAARGGGPFAMRAALAFAAPATAIAAADQLFVNGAPLLVVASGGAAASHAAGLVFAATMLVRAPVYVFQGLAAAILPNLTHMNATADRARFRRAVTKAILCLLAAGALVVAVTAAAGPLAMRLLYGSEYEAGRGVLVLLAVGVGFYLAASTCSQALLSIDRGARAAGAWTGSSLLLVLLYVVLPGSELARVSLAFTLATALAFLLLAALLPWRERRG